MNAPKRSWFISPGAGVVLGVLLTLGGACGWLQWREHVPARNHGFASQARVILVRAQFGYLELERKRGAVVEPWTRDVSGLFRFGLIDRTIAEADDRAVGPLVPEPVPTHGYFVRFLPIEELDEIDGKAVRRKSFAYCLHPAEPGVSGRYIYLMGSSGMFRRAPSSVVAVPTAWPSDEEIRRFWSNDCGG